MRWSRGSDACASDDACASREQARRALRESRAQRVKAESLSERLESIRERNHFGEATKESMRRKGHA